MHSTKYRPDIDGLRALAILMVIIYHGFPNLLPAGFLGVDVFFVISGYLISSIIYKELGASQFSFLEFYGRRAKRIFPALIVVLTLATVFGSLALFSDEFSNFSKSVYAAIGFYSNFFLLNQVGYFDVDAQHKPLLHLWSLAIEEQFYLVFPILAYFFFKKRNWFLVLLIALIALSLGYKFYHINDDLQFLNFYSPLARAWELLLGCALALVNDNVIPFASRLKKYASIAGLAFIISTIFFEATDWPLTLLATFGAALIIWSDPTSKLNQKVLGSPVMVGIGLISYPLYLWHWVLISYGKMIRSIFYDAPVQNAVLILISVVLAILTYLFLEKPIRRSPDPKMPLYIVGGMLLVGVFNFEISANPVLKDLMDQRSKVKILNSGPSVAETELLKTDPNCLAAYAKDIEYCRQTDPHRAPTVLLAGDSESNRLFPGLSKQYAQRGENVLNIGSYSCPAFLGLPCMTKKGDPQQSFERAFKFALSNKALHTVIFVSLATPCWEPHCKNFSDALEKTVNYISSLGKRIIFIKSLPVFNFEPYTCLPNPAFQFIKRNITDPCAIEAKTYHEVMDGYLDTVNKTLDQFPNVDVWDPAPLFCDEEQCWATRDGKLLFWDKYHPNIEGSNWLAARFPFYDKKTSK